MWRGQEGVEVRRYAFERELQRLPSAAGRLLYATCLLGKTTALELSDVLEVTVRAVQTSIAELQAFHLIMTPNTSRAGEFITAPDDVSLTRDVLRNHLGSSANTVEVACAGARRQTESSAREISHGIAHIVSLWKANAHVEARMAAEKLSKTFPRSGDVTCLLATALTRGYPQLWADADAKFALAEKQGCSRPELFEGWLLSKRAVSDWTGLLNLARTTAATGPERNSIVQSFILATEELIKLARIRGDRARRIVLSCDAVQFIGRHIDRLRQSDAVALDEKRAAFAQVFLDETVKNCAHEGDKIAIFEAVVWLVDENVVSGNLIARGLVALQQWWISVEKRSYIDESARNILAKSLARTEKIERILRRFDSNTSANNVQRVRLELAHRAARLL